MSEATIEHSTIPTITTRRGAFGHLAGAAALGVVLLRGGRPAATPHPDAHLLTLVAAFAEADQEHTEDYFSGMAAVEALELPYKEEVARKNSVMVLLRAKEAKSELMLDEIGRTPARTADGRAAKARVVRRWLGDGWSAHEVAYSNSWERVAWSLAQDAISAGELA